MWEMDVEALRGGRSCVEGLKIMHEVHQGLYLCFFWNCNEIQIEIDRCWQNC
jgi:hypothetical protein